MWRRVYKSFTVEELQEMVAEMKAIEGYGKCRWKS